MFFHHPKEKLDFAALERCLVGMCPDLSTLYVASGDRTFSLPAYQEWRHRTSFKLVNKTDILLSSTRHFGFQREEWGLLESLILVHSLPFFGAQADQPLAGSTMSWYVTQVNRRWRRNERRVGRSPHTCNGTVQWMAACKAAFVPK